MGHIEYLASVYDLQGRSIVDVGAGDGTFSRQLDLAGASVTAVEIDPIKAATALSRFTELWCALFPAERTRIVRLLVARVTVGPDGMAIDLRHQGLGILTRELLAKSSDGVAA